MPQPLEVEDTIVVKGDYGWSRPSSPDSYGSPLRIDPSFAQSNTDRNLESPESLNEDIFPSVHRPSSGSFPIHLSHTYNRRQPTMEERLQAMPEKRSLPWRPGVEPGAEVETGGDSRRKQIRFGCLLATRGDIAPVACNSCTNGRGKFQVCVILENYFKGACASCQLAGRPNKCSIKQSDDVVQKPSKIETQREGDSSRHEPQRQRPRSATIHIQTPDNPPSKRRRTNGAPERLQWEQELGTSHGQQQIQELAPTQRPWAAVNVPVSAEGPQQVPRTAVNDSVSQNPTGWAAVNPRTSPMPNPRMVINDTESNVNGPRRSMEQERREEDLHSEEGPQALIDRLPKGKQRQVYGIISGLQGGILVLQRELEMLKKALGIDDQE